MNSFDVIKYIDSIPQLLKEKRVQDKIGLRRAAREIGVAFATVSRIESGKDSTVHNLRKIIEWLNKDES